MVSQSGERRVCEDCDSAVVLCSSGGVHRQIICECGGEMEFDSYVKLGWSGEKDGPTYTVVGEVEK